MRFDVVATHTRLHAYYKARGYHVAGRYEALESELVGFEKLIPTVSSP